MPEMSYVHGASDVPLLGETIFQNLRRTASRFGDHEALVAAHQDRRTTHRRLVEEGWEGIERDAAKVSEARLHEVESSLQFDDPINIQYTSGTTGFPKGATLTHHNILNNGFFIGEALKYSERDRVCIPVPFYHCFGMVLGNLACTTHGATMVIPAEAFDPVLTMETVERERCTSLYGVPTMFIAELDHPRFKEFDFGTLRTGIMPGSPPPPQLSKQSPTTLQLPQMSIPYCITPT